MAFIVRKDTNIIESIKHISTGRVVPVFLVSNKTGENLNLVKKFLNMLPKRIDRRKNINEDAEFLVDGDYFVTGVGTIVSGYVNKGTIKLNDTLYLGPDGNGHFRKTAVKGIHVKRVEVDKVKAGMVATLALKKEKRSNIRKGMVLVSNIHNAKACWKFKADVLVLYHSTTIKKRYQPVIHIDNIRQSAKIIGMDKDSIRTRDTAVVEFQFISRPEYVKVGSSLIFREGRTKGIGKIVSVTPT